MQNLSKFQVAKPQICSLNRPPWTPLRWKLSKKRQVIWRYWAFVVQTLLDVLKDNCHLKHEAPHKGWMIDREAEMPKLLLFECEFANLVVATCHWLPGPTFSWPFRRGRGLAYLWCFVGWKHFASRGVNQSAPARSDSEPDWSFQCFLIIELFRSALQSDRRFLLEIS